MFKVKQLGIAAAITMFAGAAMASNFRAADQVYVPAAGHISSSSATFVSDIFISNLSDDSVDVSVILATGTGGTQTTFPHVITLAARERKELKDFVKNTLGVQSALGQLIFNACKAGQDCTPDSSGVNANYRNISVESRIYSVNTPGADANALNTLPTTGQLFSGIPWYNFVSEVAVGNGLDKVFITGIRNTDQYRTNIGFVNASQFSTTTITGTLFSANGTQLSQSSFTLPPLGSAQGQVGSATVFPGFPKSATATGAYAVFQQGNTQPTSDADAAGCKNGCPAFFAYGSVLDNQTNDPTTLEPQYLLPLTSAAITCIYTPDAPCSAKEGSNPHRAVRHQF